MPLPLHEGHLVHNIKAGVSRSSTVDDLLIGVDVVGKIPEGVAVLGRQAACVNGSVDGPGMNLRERVILVDERDPVAVFLKNLWEQSLMHARTERAFEVVEVHYH